MAGFVSNLGSLIAFGRTYHANEDGLLKATRHWWAGVVLALLVFVASLAAVGVVVSKLEPYQEMLFQQIQDINELRDMHMWRPETEQYVNGFIRSTHAIQKITSYERPPPMVVKIYEQKVRGYEAMNMVWGGSPVGDAFVAAEKLKLAALKEAVENDGIIDEGEKAMINAMVFGVFSNETFANMSAEARAGSFNERLNLTSHLEHIREKHNRTANRIEELRETRIRIVESMGLFVPYKTFTEFLEQSLAIPLPLAVFLSLFTIGLDNLILSMLCMEVYGHWRSSQLKLVLTSEKMSLRPTSITWMTFLASLVFGEGTTHLPLLTVWGLSIYFMPVTRPFYASFSDFAKRRRSGSVPTVPGEYTWEYSVWNSIYQVMNNTQPLAYLITILGITNLSTDLFVMVTLSLEDRLMEGKEYMGYNLNRIMDLVKLKLVQFWSFSSYLVALLIICGAVWYFSNKCARVAEMLNPLTGKAGTVRRWYGRFPILKYVFPAMARLHSWRGYFSFVSMAVMAVLQSLENAYPQCIEVPEGGLAEIVFKMLLSVAGMEMYVPEIAKKQILSKGF